MLGVVWMRHLHLVSTTPTPDAPIHVPPPCCSLLIDQSHQSTLPAARSHGASFPFRIIAITRYSPSISVLVALCCLFSLISVKYYWTPIQSRGIKACYLSCITYIYSFAFILSWEVCLRLYILHLLFSSTTVATLKRHLHISPSPLSCFSP